MVVNSHVGAGNRTQGLCKNILCSCCWVISVSPALYFLNALFRLVIDFIRASLFIYHFKIEIKLCKMLLFRVIFRIGNWKVFPYWLTVKLCKYVGCHALGRSLCPSPLFFEAESCWVAKAVHQIGILLPQPLECWDYRGALCLVHGGSENILLLNYIVGPFVSEGRSFTCLLSTSPFSWRPLFLPYGPVLWRLRVHWVSLGSLGKGRKSSFRKHSDQTKVIVRFFTLVIWSFLGSMYVPLLWVHSTDLNGKKRKIV